jgi:hypothetical protein
MISYPGFFSPDSVFYYYDAIKGATNDLRPQFLPGILSMILKAGGTPGLVTLLQSLLIFLGVRRLILAVARLIDPQNHRINDWIAALFLLIIASPLTPYSIFFVTLWTDTWLVIFLVWCLSLSIEMYLDIDSMTTQSKAIRVVLIVLTCSSAILVRYNALVLYPVLALIIESSLRHSSIRPVYRMIAMLTPALILALFTIYQYDIVKPRRYYPERPSYALDLASMIVYQPDICSNLGLRSCDLVRDTFSPDFVVGHGAIDFTLNQVRPGALVYRPFYELYASPRLTSEFTEAIHDHPTLLIKVKLLNYLDYIGPDAKRFIYPRELILDERGAKIIGGLGLVFDQAHPKQIHAWISALDKVLNHPLLRWISFVHAPWLMLNILSLLAAAFSLRRSPTGSLLMLLLLVPAVYYASFFIIFTASEFRFVYPSTLITQIIIITLASGYAIRQISQRCARLVIP